MKKVTPILLKVIGIVIILIVFYLAGIILLGTATDYQPKPVTTLEINKAQNTSQKNDSVFSFLSWNIGFCGLGEEMDFFYDGGKMVRPTRAQVQKNIEGVTRFLHSNDSIDFFLLQEVDKNSARTKTKNEVKIISEKLAGYFSAFATNYKVRFVPVPFTNPLGKVEMGQMTLSKQQPALSERHSYFSAYSWPKKLFMLDRCFIVSRFKLSNGKELVVLNTHNSAYDAGGELRQKEMPIIRDLMLGEYQKGNYVLAGGDWNQNPPQLNTQTLQTRFNPVLREMMDDSLFPPGWKIVFDPQRPTNREINKPLNDKTGVTIIDYYILSPNISALEIKTLSQDFKYSDHEPVFLKVRVN